MALVCAALCAIGCQDGYPIAPTRCDEWCNVSEDSACLGLDPAACVVACEQRGISLPACTSQFEAAMQCERAHSQSHLDCTNPASWPCYDAERVLMLCADDSKQTPLPQPP